MYDEDRDKICITFVIETKRKQLIDKNTVALCPSAMCSIVAVNKQIRELKALAAMQQIVKLQTITIFPQKTTVKAIYLMTFGRLEMMAIIYIPQITPV